MPAILSALGEKLGFPGSRRTRRRRAQGLAKSAETLESRILLCAAVAPDLPPAEVDLQESEDGGHHKHHLEHHQQREHHNQHEQGHGDSCTCEMCCTRYDEFGNQYSAVTNLPDLSLLDETGGATGDFDGTGALVPLSDTFKLHSNPGASHTIYLDFDGHLTSGTYWNGGNDINSAAYSFEGGSSFSDNELARIQRIWQRVAEDFLPFDVNVTTQDPGTAALTRSGAGDAEWGIRVVISPTSSWYGTAGGVAYLNSFNWNSDTPTFVFSNMLGNGNEKFTAEAISHEVGHTLGLSHDGGSGTSYYSGHGSGETGWAPIMGVGYYKEVTQWSRGEYSGANNTQDDLQIITTWNGFGYRADDVGNNASSASQLAVTNLTVDDGGLIERNTDVDVFSFSTGAGSITLNASQAALGANLDILLQLYDSSGGLVASSNPTNQLDAGLTTSVAAGTYYLHVSGVGKAGSNGYSDYASLGAYLLSGTINAAGSGDTTGPRVVSSTPSGNQANTLNKFTLTFSEAIAEGTFTASDVTLTGPHGSINGLTVTKISSTQYEVTFVSQSTPGTYSLSVGPQIADLAGNAMDQDEDGTTGEGSDDVYTTDAVLISTGAEYHFDFGKGKSPVAEGYEKVTANLSYNSSLGYGWLSGTRKNVSQKGADALTRDFVRTTDATFAVDLANGTYDVTVTMGSLNTAHDQMGVFIEGAQVGSVDSDPNQYETRTYRVTVTDGQLTLRIADLGGSNAHAVLNGLDIVQVDGGDGGGEDDTTGPRVVSSTSGGSQPNTLDTFRLTFSEPIADGTFTAADATLTGPNGSISGLTVTRISSTQYEVTFASQSTPGTYSLSVGPQITDASDNAMDQDQDGTAGEGSDDVFTTSVDLVITGDEYHFDFGKGKSPLADGYEKVTANTNYDSSTGYGWLSGSRKNVSQKGTDALTRDFVRTNDATFAVDLANGTYDVTLTMGSLNTTHDQMGVFIEGVQVDSVDSLPRQYETRTYRVTVSDGQLTLRIADLGGSNAQAVLNGLDIVQVVS